MADPRVRSTVWVVTAQIEFGERKQTLPRGLGGIVGLLYPSVLVALAIGVDFSEGGGLRGFGTAFMGALLFVMAAPTSWIFAIDFIEAGKFTVIAFGVVTSFPLWFLVGAGLAGGSRHWVEWAGRYVTVAAAWSVVTLLIVGIVGSIAI